MRNQPIDMGSLTIPSGQTTSPHLNMRRKPLRGMSIFSPAALTGTVSIEVSGDLNEDVPTWQNLQSGAADIVVGAAECVPIDYVGWDGLRFVSASAEAADRTFKMKGVEEL